MIIGYARVSTDGQTLDAQLAALKGAGADKVFSEKISGARADRRALAGAIKALAPGDCLIVTRLDRLARSTRDLLNVLDQVAKAGAGFQVPGGPHDRYNLASWQADPGGARCTGGIRTFDDPLANC